jgi:four helix bundle protein
LSISPNIAEAMGGETKKERRYFLTIARVSVFETASLVIVAEEMGYVKTGFKDLQNDIEEIGKMTSGLIKAQ